MLWSLDHFFRSFLIFSDCEIIFFQLGYYFGGALSYIYWDNFLLFICIFDIWDRSSPAIQPSGPGSETFSISKY
ncbi:hypothetical protein EMIT043CA1_230021 [Pseudomonas brassicacearum]